MPALRCVIIEDSGTPAPDLKDRLETIGYTVQAVLEPLPQNSDRAVKLCPDFVITVISLPGSVTALETGQRIAAGRVPVLYLAAAGGLSLLDSRKIRDPFQVLRLPVENDHLAAHLEMFLTRMALEKKLAERQKSQELMRRYRSLFEDSPISLWEEDFSAARKAVQAIQAQGVTDLRSYFRENPAALNHCRAQIRVLDVNRATLKLFGAKDKQELLSHLDLIFDDRVLDLMLEEMIAIGEDRTSFDGEGINRDLAGNYIDIAISWSTSCGSEDSYSDVIVSITDITTRKRREDVLKVIATVSGALRSARNRAEMLPTILQQARERLRGSSAAVILYNLKGEEIVVELGAGEWAPATGMHLNGKPNLSEQIFLTPTPYINPDIRTETHFGLSHLVKEDIAVLGMPLMAQNQVIGALWVGRKEHFLAAELDLIAAFSEIVANAIHRATLHERTQLYAGQVAIISALGRELAATLDPREIYSLLARGVLNLLPDLAGVYISTFDSQRRLITFQYGIQDGEKLDIQSMAPIPLDSPWVGSQGDVIRTHQPVIINDLQLKRRQVQTGALMSTPAQNSQSGIYVPMLAHDETIGVLYVQSYQSNRFTPSDAELLTLAANTGAIALQNASLFAMTQRRVERLTALHAIDIAISSSLDLRITLNILLDQLIALLHLDAADLLMLDSSTQSLEYAAGRGFHASDLSKVRLKLGEGLPGRAALENRLYIVDKMSEIQNLDRRAHLMAAENIVAYSGAPLVVKGQVKGVLEIFHRAPVAFDSEWQEFLETLAGQVAIAIDNTTLVSQLQRTNLELTLAYDHTLEGWSRALDLRDKDTEDHTLRVTELSVLLARMMGMSEAEIIQVRRGALLHDIGKLGIPDRILQKTGPLDDRERNIMERHPDYANEMLKGIDFLAPARVIPYCHHERWDGTGYPRGLKGEQIPLAARIFSVIDVWDSLCSRRPYRDAWPPEKAREYIRSHAGKQFDPHVVEVFLKIVS